MQTRFSAEQLTDPKMASSEAVVRKCVHCGFCTATCPTYVLLGDELDSPRGRIHLMKTMLEAEAVPSPEVVKHIDRCLSCLACMTTCPSGVNYMHLVDHARSYIEERYRRPVLERCIRLMLGAILPYPRRLRAALRLARVARPLAPLLARAAGLAPLAAMLRMTPRTIPASSTKVRSSLSGAKGRVVLLQGCAEPILRPEYRAATIRLLERIGYEVVLAPGEICCGALTHHLGRGRDAEAAARRNIDVWTREADKKGLAAIIVTASGCGTHIKDYGFILRADPSYAESAARVAALARDISEFLLDARLPPGGGHGVAVAYHPACSLQHGQKVVNAPRLLLANAGFTVRTPSEAHLCCGSAGTYNILQPKIAATLGERKAANLERLGADLIVTGNVGCAVQIAGHSKLPIVHLVELLDWATGGPRPVALETLNHGEVACLL